LKTFTFDFKKLGILGFERFVGQRDVMGCADDVIFGCENVSSANLSVFE